MVGRGDATQGGGCAGGVCCAGQRVHGGVRGKQCD
jgi:hypothetical protein